jgi:hypothetical protein
MTAKPSFGVLKEPRQHDGDYLVTLHQWAELPPVVSVPNLASLLAYLCKQNRAALLKIFEAAIINGEVKYWGKSHHGHWEPDMIRFFHLPSNKPRLKPATEGSPATLSVTLDTPARLHIEAMGMQPSAAVSLLMARGRKVPTELLEMLAPNGADTSPRSGTEPTAQFVSDAAAPRPTFVFPVRPNRFTEEVRQLSELAPETEVHVSSSPRPGVMGTSAMKAGEVVAKIEEVERRQAQGRFSLPEAAQILAEHYLMDAKVLHDRMVIAAKHGDDTRRLVVFGWDAQALE